jgi:hypothetical protein
MACWFMAVDDDGGMWIQDTDTEFTTPIVTTFESQPSHVHNHSS